MNMKPAATLAVAFLMTGLAPRVASAQDGVSPAGWSGWVGCWELLQDDMRAGGLGLGGAPRRPLSRAVSDMRVCVVPDGPDAVKMTTWAADRVVLEQRIRADGSQQPFEEKDCRGWQRSEWSTTHRQLFTHAELDCTNQPRRAVSGVTLMTTGPTWIDIQGLNVAGDPTVRVRRYQRAADQSLLAESPGLAERTRSEAERLAAAPLGLDDVIEASSKIAPKAVEAMLVETHATFSLNSRALIRLQEAGVPANVTDLMVAQSFPERFVVERQANAGSFSSYSASSAYSATFASPYFFSPYGYPYDSYWSPYGYAAYGYSPYGYSPFAYLYWSQPYVSFPSYRLVSPMGGGSTSPAEGETGAGRAVAGRGYTRVRPRDAGDTAQGVAGTSSSGAGDSSTSSARSRTRSSGGSVSRGGYSSGGSSSGDSSNGGSSSGGTSSGGSSADGGGSSGGSSSGGGRTAQPR